MVILVFIGNERVKGVSSRELHKALEIKIDFSTWIERELDGFKEKVDYKLSHKKIGEEIMADYLLTNNTAKHLVMVQRTEIGKKVRNHFIRMQKAVLNVELEEK